ncbi:MAG: response regulator [Cyclobacteriaceae bacterium]
MKYAYSVFTVVLLACTLSAPLHAQNRVADSLKMEVAKATTFEQKMSAMVALGFEVSNINFDSAQLISDRLKQLADSAQAQEYLADYYHLQAVIDFGRSDFEEALKNYYEALRLFEKEGDLKMMSTIYRKLGQLFSDNLDNFVSAKQYYDSSYQIALRLGDPIIIGNALNGLGSYYITFGYTYNTLSQGEGADSVVRLFNEAEVKILEAIDWFEKGNYLKGVALGYGNLANIKTTLEDFEGALDYMHKAISYFQKLNYDTYTVIGYYTLTETFTQMGQLDSALYYGEKALALANELDSKIDIKNTLGKLSRVYEGMGDYKKALEYQGQFYNAYVQLINEENNLMVSDLNKKYETERQLLENENLKTEAEATQATIERQNQVIIFVIIIAILIAALALIAYRAYLIRKKQKEQAERDRDIIKKQSDRLIELDEFKSRFFQNISHDLRSPLTLILGALEGVTADDESYLTRKSKELLDVGYKNGKRILFMADEIRELTQLEEGKLQLKPYWVKIVPYLTLLTKMFSSAAEQKGIQLTFESDLNDDQLLHIDPYQFEKIIYNLLSNAIRHTSNNGRITVSLTGDSGSSLVLHVKDNGEGIPEKSVPYVFDRYYQPKGADYQAKEGLGIGLALVKELVELHTGKIEVSSQEGRGSDFKMIFPIGESDELFSGIVPENLEYSKERSDMLASLENQELNAPLINVDFSDDERNKSILIVEDHPEVRKYIADIISPFFNIIEAPDGKEAIKILDKEKVDLIITDLMMPWLDGFELLEHLKNDYRLKSIPALVVSARTDENDKLEVLSKGVNDFMSRPFKRNELLLRIKNLFDKQEKWDNKGGEALIINNQQKLEDIEKGIIEKLKKVVVNRISDTNLSVADLAYEVSASERKLYRLVKKITDHTPYEFIKEIRLQYAQRLITTKAVDNLTHAAREIGMSNVSNFKKQYEERFGTNPVSLLE